MDWYSSMCKCCDNLLQYLQQDTFVKMVLWMFYNQKENDEKNDLNQMCIHWLYFVLHNDIMIWKSILQRGEMLLMAGGYIFDGCPFRRKSMLASMWSHGHISHKLEFNSMSYQTGSMHISCDIILSLRLIKRMVQICSFLKEMSHVSLAHVPVLNLYNSCSKPF